MIDKLKAFGGWLYDWVTVITASIVGGLSTLFEVLDAFGAVDLTPILPPEHAAKIVTVVAISKGLLAWYLNKPKPEATDYGA